MHMNNERCHVKYVAMSSKNEPLLCYAHTNHCHVCHTSTTRCYVKYILYQSLQHLSSTQEPLPCSVHTNNYQSSLSTHKPLPFQVHTKYCRVNGWKLAGLATEFIQLLHSFLFLKFSDNVHCLEDACVRDPEI